ncbi:MAG: hypothetical protein PVG11_06035 [Anaerolineae bacterium]|jgi:hypothetical protein
MSERPRDEKQEKQEKDEGGWDEKWRRDPVDAAMWAFILIWAGVVLLASNLDLFGGLEGFDLWAIGFLGAGAIVLLAAGFRLLFPAYRRPLAGNVIFGLILIGIGLGNLIDWVIVVPLVLILIGAGLLFTGLFRSR